MIEPSRIIKIGGRVGLVREKEPYGRKWRMTRPLALPAGPLKATDLYWAAGFLEGEGSFYFDVRVCTIRAPQVQREPLERLKKIFGGGISCRRSYTGRESSQFVWWLSGRQAAGVSMTLFLLMSPKRKTQIEKMISLWRTTPARRKRACKHGHLYADGHYYEYRWADTVKRVCQVCAEERYRRKRDSQAS